MPNKHKIRNNHLKKWYENLVEKDYGDTVHKKFRNKKGRRGLRKQTRELKSAILYTDWKWAPDVKCVDLKSGRYSDGEGFDFYVKSGGCGKACFVVIRSFGTDDNMLGAHWSLKWDYAGKGVGESRVGGEVNDLSVSSSTQFVFNGEEFNYDDSGESTGDVSGEDLEASLPDGCTEEIAGMDSSYPIVATWDSTNNVLSMTQDSGSNLGKKLSDVVYVSGGDSGVSVVGMSESGEIVRFIVNDKITEVSIVNPCAKCDGCELSNDSFCGARWNYAEKELLDFEVWKREAGYWFGEYTFLNPDGKSDYKATDNPTSGQYDYRNYVGFINLQVQGKELKQRNIFVRPPLQIEGFDLSGDGVVSVDEMDKYGFTSPYHYELNTETKMATPVVDSGEDTGVSPFNYTEGTEKTFSADQSASDNKGNLAGVYFGIPTSTTIHGDDTVIYKVGLPGNIIQNQLTTLPSRTTRVRSAQGFGFGTGLPAYGSYYRETKFEDTVNEDGEVTKIAREKFMEKLAEYRTAYNVPESKQTPDVEEFFTVF